jgi:hypothetical protein
MIKLSRCYFVFFLLVILATGTLLAQTKETGIIQGTITDKDGGPLPGVTVTATSPSTMGKPSSITDQHGRYRIAALFTGTYTVDAKLDGFTPAQMTNIVVHAGMTATVDIMLVQAALQKEVTVVAAAPLIDVTKSSLAKTYLSNDLLATIPTAQSSYDIINLAPGVTEYSAYGGGNYVGNSFQLDGFEINTPWFGGGMYTSMLDYNTMEEAQIMALGAPAEYGGFNGALVSIITKSGGNNFHGDAQINGYGKNWHSKNVPIGDPKWKLVPETPLANRLDTSFHLGGPIIRDKLWFFGGYEYFKKTTELVSTGKVSPDTYPKFFAKLTFQPTSSDRIQTYFEKHKETALNTFLTADFVPPANADIIRGATIVNLSYLHSFSSHSFLELTGGYMNDPWDSIPNTRNRNLSGHYDLGTGVYSVNGYWWSHQPDHKYSFRGSFSQSVDNLAGSHDFKIGGGVEKSAGDWDMTLNGGVTYYDLYGQPYMAFKQHGYQQYSGLATYFFAQDDWKISHTVVINPGLRFSSIRGSIPELNETVYKPSLGIEPRLGFTWDITGNQKTVLKVHVGRYYEGIKAYYFWSTTPARPIDYFHVSPDGTLTPWYTVGGVDLYTVDPNIRSPYMNQAVAGLEQVLGKNLSGSVSFIYKYWGDFIEPVDIAAKFEQVSFTDPATGKVYTVYNQTNVGSPKYLITNPEAGKDIGAAYPGIVQVTPWRRYLGLQFTINKRFAHNWQLVASYTYSKEHGTYNNSHTPESAFGMGQGNLYYDPTFQINLEGRSIISPPHLLKVMGSYVFPLDITVSAYYQLYSGDTWTKAVPVTTVAQQAPTLLLEPQGSSRLPSTNRLDFRVEKSFYLKQIRLSLMLDAFNVFNQAIPMFVAVFEGPDQGLALAVNDPRTFRLGARIVF